MKHALKLALTIIYLGLNLLKLDPRNPRKHSPRQVRQIAHSIEIFGFVVPLLIDRNHIIIAGHGRFLAAQQLGMTEVPVIQLENLTEAQVRAFQIADNRVTENAQWNEALLGQTFAELSQSDLDFSLDITGFSEPEINLYIEGAASSAPDSDDDESPPLIEVGRRHFASCGR